MSTVDRLRYIVQHVTAMTTEVKAACDAAADEIEALEREVYVPGLWRCPKCEFHLCQATLDKCPNCDSPLWRVTERAARNEMVKRCEQLLKDLSAGGDSR